MQHRNNSNVERYFRDFIVINLSSLVLKDYYNRKDINYFLQLTFCKKTKTFKI